MQLFQNEVLNFLVVTLLGELLLTIAGVAIAQPFIKWLINWRYGKWHLTIIKNGEIKIDHKKISPGKMKQINDIPEELPVYLKGICSPFHYIQCDIIGDGEKLGLYKRDNKKREILIDLDKDHAREEKARVGKVIYDAQQVKIWEDQQMLQVSIDKDRPSSEQNDRPKTL